MGEKARERGRKRKKKGLGILLTQQAVGQRPNLHPIGFMTVSYVTSERAETQHDDWLGESLPFAHRRFRSTREGGPLLSRGGRTIYYP